MKKANTSYHLAIRTEKTIKEINLTGKLKYCNIKSVCEKNGVNEDYIREVAGWKRRIKRE